MSMLQHYIKLAIRNLLKYKSQSIISIIGLAIGFTCFALATLWIRYEQTYDDFHDGADRIYLIRTSSYTNVSGLSEVTPYPLASHLKETFPEVEDACNMQAWKTILKYKGVEYEPFKMDIDSAAMRMFKLQILSGNRNFLTENNEEIAITKRFAKQLFGTENPLGQEVEVYGDKRKICAIVQSWSLHSNLPFDIVGNFSLGENRSQWGVSLCKTFIKLKKGIDSKTFVRKLGEYTYEAPDKIIIKSIVATPITAIRYDRPNQEITVKYEHIRLFALAGGLVILCSLFNYLTLFITRIRMRSREVALRKVNGSSNRELLTLFSIEYLLTLVLAIFFGLIMLELVIPAFKELSEIKSDNFCIYMEAIGYSGIVAVLSFILSLFPIYYSRKKNLNAALKGSSDGKKGNTFQKASIVLQLIISVGFIFCSTVLMKQVHFLSHTDLGIERANRGTIQLYPYIDGFKDELAKNPYIAEILTNNLPGLLPRSSRYYQTIDKWEGRTDSTSNVTLEVIECNEEYLKFYGLQLLKGSLPADDKSILINETAARKMNMNDPIGKAVRERPITGIIKDFYIAPPTIPVKPMMFVIDNGSKISSETLFRYQNCDWPFLEKQIQQLIKKMNPNIAHYRIISMEEEYNKFLKSENALLIMLDFVTLVCVLISLFGVFSLVTLDCEKRRKEIAIRKVNGAVTFNIMQAFIQKYMSLLIIASAVAFPVGYLIMKPWIESYVLQTRIDFWIYPAIWLILAALIILCTGWRIWRAANQNPAEVVKSE